MNSHSLVARAKADNDSLDTMKSFTSTLLKTRDKNSVPVCDVAENTTNMKLSDNIHSLSSYTTLKNSSLDDISGFGLQNYENSQNISNSDNVELILPVN